MLAGYQPKLLLAQFGGSWYLPRGRAHSTHILKPRLPGRPDGLAREYYGHALAADLGLARYRTELVGNGARQYLVIERYDRVVDGETVTLIHQEDVAQALGIDWVDDHAKFQDPRAPRNSHRPSAYRIAELLGSLQGEGRPVADFLRRLTFTVLLGDNDAHAKNLGILHLPGRSVLADVYDAVPNLFQAGRIEYNLALAIDGSFDHRRISAQHLIREAERWNALSTGEPADRHHNAGRFHEGSRPRNSPAGRPCSGRGTARLEHRAAAGRRGDRRATACVPPTAYTALTRRSRLLGGTR